MQTFAQKMKPTRHTDVAISAKSLQAMSGLSHDASSCRHLQRIVGNQAVRRLVQPKAGDLATKSAPVRSPGLAPDSIAISVCPKSSVPEAQAIFRSCPAGTGSPLPHLDRIQRSFGPRHDLSGVKAFVGGLAAEATQQTGIDAYTSAERIVFREAPSLHIAAHEAAHVVQQRSGIQIAGGFGTRGDVYERHADAVADSVVAGRSCGDLLATYTGTGGKQPSSSPGIQFLRQTIPYIGPLVSYLNPENQLARLFLPGLSEHQKNLLDGIFGNSLATSVIRLNPNSLLAAGNCYRTTGNIINMPGITISDSHLIHEAAHVWQHQNTVFGVGYVVSALKAMAIAQLLGGDWQRAYDYRNVEKYKIPWRFWNAEQQASWIEDHQRLPSGWMLEGSLPNFDLESTGLE